MAETSTQIANMALRHLAQGVEIQDLDDENTDAARAARRFYDEALDEMLRSYNWPFARVYVTLALVEEDPTSEWLYSYAYPSGATALRRILSGNHKDDSDSVIEYELAYGDSGTVILTNLEDAELEYTKRVTEVNRYPADFVMALSYRLAAYMAPSILGGSYPQLLQLVDSLWGRSLRNAAANAYNEQRKGKPPEAESIRVR